MKVTDITRHDCPECGRETGWATTSDGQICHRCGYFVPWAERPEVRDELEKRYEAARRKRERLLGDIA